MRVVKSDTSKKRIVVEDGSLLFLQKYAFFYEFPSERPGRLKWTIVDLFWKVRLPDREFTRSCLERPETKRILGGFPRVPTL